MTEVEFIGHSKHFTSIRQAAGGGVLLIPLELGKIVRELVGREGWMGLAAAAFGKGKTVDLQPLVEHNLLRRRIRIGWFYGNPVAAAVYRAIASARARVSAALIISYFDDHPNARALVFNGFLMPDALTLAVSQALGRERLVIELGFFPGTLQYDREGINYDSTLPRDPAFYRMVDTRIGAELPTALVRRTSKQKQAEAISLPRSYIFVPFQVPSDMQVLVHSPWIKNMVQFYQVIERLADRRPGATFVIKEHPSFPLSIRGRVKAHDRILFANHNETRSLIEGADAVVVMNSTVGLESLLLQKKVITLGNAPYDVDGLVLQAGDDNELLSAFDRLGGWEPDADLRAIFLRYVYNVFLLKGDMNNADPAMVAAVRSRAQGTDQHGLLVKEFAERSTA
ncbi:MAG: nitrogen fixation protein FixF [Pseudorhizobium sp.]